MDRIINEPRRHHYIPRFILKNFLDEDNQISYWDIKANTLQKRNIMSVFMNRDMYRDEEQIRDDPTKIEWQFGNLEREIAKLFDEKLLQGREIRLKRWELEKLRIFTTLLSFRSNLRMEQYKNNQFDESTRSILLEHQSDGDFEALWKRELEVLSRCNSYEEIKQANNIDPIIKQDFINALQGYYLTFVDARGGEFLLTDVYPTLEICPTITMGANIHLHALYPLSPTRLMIMNHIMFRDEFENDEILEPMLKISQIKGNMIIPPKNKYKYGAKVHDPEDEYYYRVNNVYAQDVKYINSLLLNEARVGVVFKDSSRVFDSIVEYNALEETKQKFYELESDIECGNWR